MRGKDIYNRHEQWSITLIISLERGDSIMREVNRNVIVKAENRMENDGFHIYLDFSGQREYLMTHRHNGLLYGLLKDGVALGELRRWRNDDIARKIKRSPRYSGSSKLINMVGYLLVVIDDYIVEREAC